MFAFFLMTLVTALSLLVVDLVLPGVELSNFLAAVLAALAIGLVNNTIRPVLSLLSLPINFLTLGAFSLVVNGICFWLASVLVPGFVVQGPLSFFPGPGYFVPGNHGFKQLFCRAWCGIVLAQG